LDVTDIDAVRRAIDEIVRDYGALDGLVTCHGGLRCVGLEPAPFLETTPADWRITVETNLIGLMNCVHEAVPAMKKAGRSALVNVAEGLTGIKDRAVYSASKAGNNRFLQAIAGEAAPYGVRVNSVMPGRTEARWREDDGRPSLSPLGRDTTADEVGD